MFFVKLGLLKTARIDSKLFNGNANIAGYENQEEPCYAHAAASAYLNSCATIYPQGELPSWKECVKVAVERREWGSVPEALERLEKKFNMGIEWKILENDKLKIRDVLMTSIVIGFHTTDQGFWNINAGKITKKPFGSRCPIGFAAFMESFDFESRYYICKNSWGNLEPRFQLDLSALHDYMIYQVYWTHQSLAKKKKPPFKEIYYGPEVTVEYEGYKLQTRKMDEKTALYNMNYICQRELDNNRKEVWVGYEVDKLIEIKLKTTPKLESPKGPKTDLPYAFLPYDCFLTSSPKRVFFPDVEVTKVSANSTKFAFSKKARGTLLVDPPITKGIVRWTVLVEYGGNNSSFAIGAVPCTDILKYCNFLGDVVEAMTFSFANKDMTMRSWLSGIQKDHNHLINPLETMVEHTSTISIEVDCNMHIISFFVNDVKVPHVITEIGLPLYVGMSVAGESDMSFTTLSLCRLSSSTPSIVKLAMHKALLPADFAKKETEYDERVASLQAVADAREREIDKLKKEIDKMKREKVEAQVVVDAKEREKDEAQVVVDAMETEKFGE